MKIFSLIEYFFPLFGPICAFVLIEQLPHVSSNLNPALTDRYPYMDFFC